MGRFVFTPETKQNLSPTEIMQIIRDNDSHMSNVDLDYVGGRDSTDLLKKTELTEYVDRTLCKIIHKPKIIQPENNATNFTGIILSSSFETDDNYNGQHTGSSWEIALDSTFTSIVDSVYNSSTQLLTFSYNLSANYNYYVRVRHHSYDLVSEWSDPVKFSLGSVVNPKILTPTVYLDPSAPSNQQPLTPTFTSSNPVFVDITNPTHDSTIWRLYGSSGSSTTPIWTYTALASNNPTELTQITIPSGILQNNTNYYISAQYTSGTITSNEGITYFRTTDVVTIDDPGITVQGEPSDIPLQPLLQTVNPFNVNNGTDTHVSTEWVVTDLSSNTVVWSDNSTTNLTSVTVPVALTEGINYEFKVRYIGNNYTSNWSITSGTVKVYNTRVNPPGNITLIDSGGNILNHTTDPVPTGFTITTDPLSMFDPLPGETYTHTLTEWLIQQNGVNVWTGTASGGITTVDVPVGTLNNNESYTILVRYTATDSGGNTYTSLYSTTSITTVAATTITDPGLTVEGSPNNTPLQPLLQTVNPFTVNNGTDTHVSTDWEVLDSNGVTVWSSIADTTNLTSITVGTPLTSGTSYTFRVKYNGNTYSSNWSTVISTTQSSTAYVESPTIDVTDTNNNIITGNIPVDSDFIIKTNNANVINPDVGVTYTHTSSDWEIIEVNTGTSVWSSLNDTTNLTTITVPAGTLNYSTDYYIKVTHNVTDSNSNILSSSSQITKTTTPAPYISLPGLSVEGAPSSVPTQPALSTLTPFTVNNGTDTHVSTEWVVTELDTGTVVWTVDSTTDLTSIVVPVALSYNTNYEFKVRYKGNTLISDWSIVNATTVSQIDYVETPTLTFKDSNNNVITGDLPIDFTIESSPLVIVNEDTSLTYTHSLTDWVVEDSAGNVVWSRYDDNTDLTSKTIPSGTLNYNTTYTFKVRYDVTVSDGRTLTSGWSIETRSTTPEPYIDTPVLSVEGSPDAIPSGPNITITNGYNVYYSTATHASTDWVIMEGNNTPLDVNAAIWSSITDTTNLTSIKVPDGTLTDAITYTFYVRFNSSDSTLSSAYGTSVGTAVVPTLIDPPELVLDSVNGNTYNGVAFQAGYVTTTNPPPSVNKPNITIDKLRLEVVSVTNGIETVESTQEFILDSTLKITANLNYIVEDYTNTDYYAKCYYIASDGTLSAVTTKTLRLTSNTVKPLTRYDANNKNIDIPGFNLYSLLPVSGYLNYCNTIDGIINKEDIINYFFYEDKLYSIRSELLKQKDINYSNTSSFIESIYVTLEVDLSGYLNGYIIYPTVLEDNNYFYLTCGRREEINTNNISYYPYILKIDKTTKTVVQAISISTIIPYNTFGVGTTGVIYNNRIYMFNSGDAAYPYKNYMSVYDLNINTGYKVVLHNSTLNETVKFSGGVVVGVFEDANGCYLVFLPSANETLNYYTPTIIDSTSINARDLGFYIVNISNILDNGTNKYMEYTKLKDSYGNIVYLSDILNVTYLTNVSNANWIKIPYNGNYKLISSILDSGYSSTNNKSVELEVSFSNGNVTVLNKSPISITNYPLQSGLTFDGDTVVGNIVLSTITNNLPIKDTNNMVYYAGGVIKKTSPYTIQTIFQV